MRFMLLRKADKDTEASALPSEALVVGMLAYIEDMVKAGVFLQGEGLCASAKGARVKFSRGRPTVTDGPFTEAKELIAGVTMIQVGSLAEAIQWVERWPTIDGEAEAEIEIRQVYETEDFGPAFTPELRQKEQRLRVEGSANRTS